jgi:hypothetical protein
LAPGGKLTALACHPTNQVRKAEELAYLSTKISVPLKMGSYLQNFLNDVLMKNLSTIRYKFHSNFLIRFSDKIFEITHITKEYQFQKVFLQKVMKYHSYPMVQIHKPSSD